MLELLSPEAQQALVALIDERVAQRIEESPKGDIASPWLTVSEAADHLRTTPAAIRKRIGRGQLKAHRPEGSRIILHRDDLDAAAGPPLREVL